MAYDTLVQQGTFTSDGTSHIVTLRGDVDWMWVYNRTNIAAGGGGDIAQAYWQRGMTTGRGVGYDKLAADDSLEIYQLAANAGFTYIDTSTDTLGAAVATTQINGAAPPVVSTGNTAGLADGDVVRIINQIGAQQLGGMDFTIDTIVANTSFELANMATIVTTGAAAGIYRRVPTTHPSFYPSTRYISAITQAANAVVTVTVDHTFQVGQEVRFKVPAIYDMVEMDDLSGTVTAVAISTITVDIDSTAFTAFAFPLTAEVPFTPAIVVPYGTDSGSTNEFDPSVRDVDQIYMLLAAGNNSPAGANNDEIMWVAGRSFSNTIE